MQNLTDIIASYVYTAIVFRDAIWSVAWLVLLVTEKKAKVHLFCFRDGHLDGSRWHEVPNEILYKISSFDSPDLFQTIFYDWRDCWLFLRWKMLYRSLPWLSLFVKSMSSNFDLYMPYRTFFCDICHTRGSPGTCFFLCGLTWKDEKFRLNLISWTWVVVKLNTWITKGFLSQVAYVKLLEASTLVFFRLTCYKTTETSLLQDLQLSLPL